MNVFRQRGKVGMVLRLIPSVIPSAADLSLPDILLEIILAKRGLVLMVGGTGSGKSTTLAAMLNHRNESQAGHILTIEDPVEFYHPNKKSIINQREVGVDTLSYHNALKASLREAPDVILIGEIRDRLTMEAGLELANTGHLAVSTMHANNANQAMERVINMFPHESHKQLFMDMSLNVRAVISQRLVPDVRGKRCAAIEIMLNTPHIAELILKGDLKAIKEAMAESGTKGMQTFDDALYNLYKQERISLDEALGNADSRTNLEAKINSGTCSGTSAARALSRGSPRDPVTPATGQRCSAGLGHEPCAVPTPGRSSNRSDDLSRGSRDGDRMTWRSDWRCAARDTRS